MSKQVMIYMVPGENLSSFEVSVHRSCFALKAKEDDHESVVYYMDFDQAALLISALARTLSDSVDEFGDGLGVSTIKEKAKEISDLALLLAENDSITTRLEERI